MATIVEHVDTKMRYVLLGTGLGMYSNARPGLFFGDWAPTIKDGHESVVAVCNGGGQIGWFDAKDMKVVSVDGISPKTAIVGA